MRVRFTSTDCPIVRAGHAFVESFLACGFIEVRWCWDKEKKPHAKGRQEPRRSPFVLVLVLEFTRKFEDENEDEESPQASN